MQTTVRVRFETAHRLPHIGGKCRNLHGHSWQAWFTVAAPANADGMVADFSLVKNIVESFTDTHFDHGAMLGHQDTVAPMLRADGQKVYLFGHDPHTDGLDWPTVENVATCLHRYMSTALADTPETAHLELTSVRVSETENNTAQEGGCS